MYLPRSLISHLYRHLIRTHHSLAPPVLLLVALDPDALCACRILVALLKRDYIQHTIQPVSGYDDLSLAGKSLVEPMKMQNGGSGGLVVCLGVGGLVDLAAVLGLQAADEQEDPSGGVEVWLIDARRPWNLGNVFAGNPGAMIKDGSINQSFVYQGIENGRINGTYKPGRGGVIAYDDGDIDEELSAEREAYCELVKMPDVEDDDDEDLASSSADSEPDESIERDRPTRKRKSWSDRGSDANGSESEDERPRQKRRSNSDRSASVSSGRHVDQDLSSIPRNDTNGQASVNNLQSIPKPPSARTLRRKLLRMRRKHTSVLSAYYAHGASYSEPVSSIIYSLAEDLGRENNDLLWYAIVGIGSLELYGRSMTGVGISTSLDSGGSSGWGGERGERIRQLLRDEVRRLNPPDQSDSSHEHARGEISGVIPTTARSPTDTSIRLSPEPRFLLIRHWSLYDSMLHSPYLSARLHIWSDAGRKRLHKFLAKMGISLSQCKQNYTHMDMDLKRTLRQRLLTNASLYGLEGLVPPASGANRGKEGWGFVRSWGWKACLSANDVGVIVGSILEVGKSGAYTTDTLQSWDRGRKVQVELVDEDGKAEGEEWVGRFWQAYDALERFLIPYLLIPRTPNSLDRIEELMKALPIAQHLHRAILRTGTSLIEKHQIRDLRAFRMAVVKDGPDVSLFTHPSALTKLALWVGEAIAEQERAKRGNVGRGTPLVLAGLNETRGIYVVVGTGGAGGVVDFIVRQKTREKAEMRAKKREEKRLEEEIKRNERLSRGEDDDQKDEEEESEEEDRSSDDENDNTENRGYGRNRFGNAFQEVVDETNARVRTDSFEHCVVEVKKEDLSSFLESLSMKVVVG